MLIILVITIIVTFCAERIEQNRAAKEDSTNTFKQNIYANLLDILECTKETTYENLANIPEYTGEICVKINDNKPYFGEDDNSLEAFEHYSELDSLGRCGVAYANICKEIMPPDGDERGDIGAIHPTGWKQAKFDGEYLYNRCHLIAHSLSDEDDNKQNLITGTRYFNVQGMLPIERLVYEYIDKNPANHVLYRVTPIFKGENLLATGVEMEAYSVEDNGKLSFNVFVYNVQPGANIDYKTGKLSNS